MSRTAPNGLRALFRAERNWKGERALIPVETCYRILGVVSWLITISGLFTSVMAYVRLPGVLASTPAFWLFIAFHGIALATAVLPGLPFNVRFTGLTTAIFFTISIVLLAIGVAPTIMFGVLIIVSLSSLFYGLRGGVVVLSAILTLMAVCGWGWTRGYLPVFLSLDAGRSLNDLRSAIVWIRYTVASACYLLAVVFAMRYMLGDLNSALRSANTTLRQLSIEQEHRARAEEARVMAERSAREAQKFEALGRLASGVAHDFNNALCVMKCWSSYLVEVSDDKEVQEAMADIKRATENAEHLTQHLLAFSRSETAKRDSADLAEVVDYECRTLTRLLPKNIVVKSEIDGHAVVPLGKGQLQEVILNLAINARDAMPSGGTLTIQSGIQALDVPTKSLRPGNYARLTVTDTGSGMDDVTLSRIYEPFFTTKGPGKGTGLGLSMVYGLVSRAGGEISVQSRPGEGARFTILLPALSGKEHPSNTEPVEISEGRRCRTLVVESKPEIGGLIERILAREGFPVLWVRSGEDGMRALNASEVPFGLLIVQGVLPGVSTVEIVERARSMSGDTRVVVISAPSIDPAIVYGFNSGDYHLLPKPFEPNLLRGVVNDALRGRSSGGTVHQLAG